MLSEVMVRGWSRWTEGILEIFYPSSCLGCGESLQYSRQELFCPVCRLEVCASDTHLNPDHPLKQRLRKEFPFELVLSKYRYPNKSKTMTGLVRGLKYENLKFIGIQEGEEYGRQIGPLLQKAGVSLLVPVPLHWRKRAKRGYNQSLEWARGISKSTGLPVGEGLVKRVKNTQSQTLLDKKERKRNISRAFRINSRCKISGSEAFTHFLILDDVVTSGATLVELAKELKEIFPGSRFSVCTLMYKDY